MAYSLDQELVVGISSRALFNLDEADAVFRNQGPQAYREYQIANETVQLQPGTGYPLVKALLAINQLVQVPLVEVVLISRNDPDTGLRIFNSIEQIKLDITRAAFVDGRAPYRYLEAFSCDLFLSANSEDVKAALTAGCPAAFVYTPPSGYVEDIDHPREVRIAFDLDAVLFAKGSEDVFKNEGLAAYQKSERSLADVPIAPGPFKGFIEALGRVQAHFKEDECPIRTAIVTARNAPAHKRPIKTLRSWKIRVDEAFFLGGIEKTKFLQAFNPHIFFDDQESNLIPAAGTMPSAQVLGN